MSDPTFFNYFLRVGGVGLLFAVSILVTTEYFPGYESYVVVAISVFGVLCLSVKEVIRKNNQAKDGVGRKRSR